MDAAPVDEIVVVATRLPEAPGERAYSLADLDAAAIEQALRVDDVLRTVPGVSTFRRNSSAAANPTIQGLSVRASGPSGAGRTLVTLDGAPLNDPFGGWVIWGALAPDTIAHARILRGAGAGPYGAGCSLRNALRQGLRSLWKPASAGGGALRAPRRFMAMGSR